LITFVPTPIGNLEDISKRAMLALENSEIIFCEDTRTAKKLFNLLNISTQNKIFKSMHSHNEDKVISNLDIEELISKNIIYISDAGMPGISDPGSKLIRFAQKNNIPYTVLPGANAALVAFVASGFEGEFCFIGFLPHKGKERENKLKEVISSSKVSILYEAPHRIEKLLNELKNLIPQRTIFLAKELTKIYETFIKDKVKNINIPNTKGEWVVVIDKDNQKKELNLSYEDILNLPLPLKEKSKLLAKISSKSAKEIYKELIK